MSLMPGDPVTVTFGTQNGAGQVTAPDSTPTAMVIRNGDDQGAVAVTITNKATGSYKASFTIPSGWSIKDVVALEVVVVVGGVTSPRVRIFTWVLGASANVTLSGVVGAAAPAAVVGNPITLEQFELTDHTFALTVTDAAGDPVTLTANDLRFIVQDTELTPSSKFKVENSVFGTITVTGASNNVANVRVQLDQLATPLTAGEYVWRFWDKTNKQVLLHGVYRVLPAEFDYTA